MSKDTEVQADMETVFVYLSKQVTTASKLGSNIFSTTIKSTSKLVPTHIPLGLQMVSTPPKLADRLMLNLLKLGSKKVPPLLQLLGSDAEVHSTQSYWNIF